MTCLGSRLKKIREAKKLSQQEVAHALGLSQKTLSNFENGKTLPNIFHLAKLREIYDFDLLEILEKEGISLTKYPPPTKSSLRNANGIEIPRA
ncbi:helix-turn-helix domain-containing protein [Algoriphagus namhaensis]